MGNSLRQSREDAPRALANHFKVSADTRVFDLVNKHDRFAQSVGKTNLQC